MKLYSKGCENALWVLSTLTRDELEDRISAQMLCKRAGIAESFTRKALQALSRRGILKAVPGRGGGYVLSGPPGKIHLLDIVKAIDGDDSFDHCVMGLMNCSDDDGCPIHDTWKKMKNVILRDLDRKTLLDLVS